MEHEKQTISEIASVLGKRGRGVKKQTTQKDHQPRREWMRKISLGRLARICKGVAIVLGLALADALQAQDDHGTPPNELCSPDQNSCVKIAPADNRKGLDDKNLIVTSNGGTLAQYPTFGYLLHAFWSPQYVAVNNRRANAGDYLWVISLADGSTLKVPEVDAQGDSWAATMQQIRARWPDLAKDENYKAWLQTRGWKSATELNVVETVQFRTLQAWVEVHKIYSVYGGAVVLTGQSFERLTQEEEKDRRMASEQNRSF
jgi:hypothetical protein